MRKPILPAAAVAVALLTCTVVGAEAAQWATDPNAGTDVVVRDVVHPLASQSITQSVDPYTLVDGSSTACIGAVTRDTAWLRLFDLDGDHGLVETFTVESVDWGIQGVVGALDLTVNVYCLEEGLPFLYQFIVLKDSVVVPLTDQVLTFHNTAIGGSCDTTIEDMAVELAAEDCIIAGCQLCFIGMNDLGQTGPTYIASEACGIYEPTDTLALGFASTYLVMVVNGQDEMPPDDDGGDPDVPATTTVGAVLLLLILLGSGAYFLRGRAAR